MKRYKSIDFIRGFSITIMVFGHSLEWWIRHEDNWIFDIFLSIFGNFAAVGFLFIAGLSSMLSYKNRIIKADLSEEYNQRMVKIEFLYRALFLLIIALFFNSYTAIVTLNPFNIWLWFIPLTVSVSLFLLIPLLKTTKFFRLILAGLCWVAHFYIIPILLPYQGQFNIQGIIFHILYNTLDLDPILYFFSFFLIGTVLGDIVFDINQIENHIERKITMKNKLLFPSLIIGIFSIIFGVIFLFPLFLIHLTISSSIFLLGQVLVLFSVLIYIEELEIIKLKKKYRFFYYYSYYSFTIFILHNFLYFVFLGQLNLYNIWYALIITMILLTLLIRGVFKKWGPKASLKVQLGRLSSGIVKRIESKRKL